MMGDCEPRDKIGQSVPYTYERFFFLFTLRRLDFHHLYHFENDKIMSVILNRTFFFAVVTLVQTLDLQILIILNHQVCKKIFLFQQTKVLSLFMTS